MSTDVISIDITPEIKRWATRMREQIVKRSATTYRADADPTEPAASQGLDMDAVGDMVQSFQLMGGFDIEFDGDWKMRLHQPVVQVPNSLIRFLQFMTKAFPLAHPEPIEITWFVRGVPGASAIWKGRTEDAESDLSYRLACKLAENLRKEAMAHRLHDRLVDKPREEVAELREEMVDLAVQVLSKRVRLRAVDLNDMSLFMYVLEDYEDELKALPRFVELLKD